LLIFWPKEWQSALQELGDVCQESRGGKRPERPPATSSGVRLLNAELREAIATPGQLGLKQSLVG
jgi:hypothetical protein